MGLSVHDPFVDPLGNPLALPRKPGGARTINPTIVDFVNGAAGDFTIPDGYSFYRVTVVGGGGSASDSYSGAGGGLARSPILPAQKGLTISYVASIGENWPSGIASTNSTANFGAYSLLATPGKASVPGTGSGGTDNHKGGAGIISASPNARGAGGAAGPTADGQDAINQTTPYLGDGGGAGATGSTTGGGGGGGGVMASGGARFSAAPNTVVPASGGIDYWGSRGGSNASQPGDPVGGGGNGGNWGGGGGMRSNSGRSGVGGYGGVRIELW